MTGPIYIQMVGRGARYAIIFVILRMSGAVADEQQVAFQRQKGNFD